MDGVHHVEATTLKVEKKLLAEITVLKQLRDEANSDIVVTEAAEWEHKKTLMNLQNGSTRRR